MFGYIKKIGSAVALVGRIQTAIAEGRDVLRAVDEIEKKYSDLPDDVKGAWREVREFVVAVRRIA